MMEKTDWLPTISAHTCRPRDVERHQRTTTTPTRSTTIHLHHLSIDQPDTDGTPIPCPCFAAMPRLRAADLILVPVVLDDGVAVEDAIMHL